MIILFRFEKYCRWQKNVTPVYNKSIDSHVYLDCTWCHPNKKINGTSTGGVKWLTQVSSNENDFFRTIEKIFSLIGCA